MRDRLKIMDQRYEEINRLLSDPQIVSDIKQLTALSKEQRSLEKTVLLYREQEKLEASIPDLKEMKASEDEEMAQMAALELEQAQQRIEQINEEIKVLLLPKDPNDDKNVVVEIRGAAGGDEANILPVICTGCTAGMPNRKVGKSKYWMRCLRKWADTRRSNLKSAEIWSTLFKIRIGGASCPARSANGSTRANPYIYLDGFGDAGSDGY